MLRPQTDQFLISMTGISFRLRAATLTPTKNNLLRIPFMTTVHNLVSRTTTTLGVEYNRLVADHLAQTTSCSMRHNLLRLTEHDDHPPQSDVIAVRHPRQKDHVHLALRERNPDSHFLHTENSAAHTTTVSKPHRVHNNRKRRTIDLGVATSAVGMITTNGYYGDLTQRLFMQTEPTRLMLVVHVVRLETM